MMFYINLVTVTAVVILVIRDVYTTHKYYNKED